jgi:tRNA A22 N-methylase
MALLVSLVPPGGVVIDVGCDHGHVATALGAVGAEREPHRLPRRRGRFLVADGLAPFRRVDTAVIAGMGPATLLGILDRGPRPTTLVAHCPDGMHGVRQGLADRGWCIEAEGLAREGTRISEVLRAVHGTEPHTGHRLWFGPLLEPDPLVEDLAQHLLSRWRPLLERAPPGSPAHERARGWVAWLEGGRRD